jgi:hypothetical protein
VSSSIQDRISETPLPRLNRNLQGKLLSFENQQKSGKSGFFAKIRMIQDDFEKSGKNQEIRTAAMPAYVEKVFRHR